MRAPLFLAVLMAGLSGAALAYGQVPDGLRDTATTEALQAIVDLDLSDLADIEPPRGYGRD